MSVSHLLLIGAGFSRNWGGWLSSEAFEYLLGCPEISQDIQLQRLLWKHQGTGGFEDALDEIQTLYLQDRQGKERQLAALQTAVGRMFADMNRTFLDLVDWEFQREDRSRLVQRFLTQFDAVFSLNQDLLLERHYCNRNIALVGAKSWLGVELPGMQRTPGPEPLYSECWARSVWVPRPAAEFRFNKQHQPLFKLHGSSNWNSAEGKQLLVMGGGKAIEIGRSPILSWYSTQFEQYLCQPGARLMVIGYGFRDLDINAIISRAVSKALRIFVTAPDGAELAFKLSPTRQRAQIIVPSEIEETLKQSLIGASRRPLRDMFGGDNAEFSKVMRFFEAGKNT